VSIPPIVFRWTEIVDENGECIQVMRPHTEAFRRMAVEHYVADERYMLVEHEDRSMKSHRHYFKCVSLAWENLNEAQLAQFPTPERLRKWALIKAGYRDQRTFTCASKAEAQRLAAFLAPIDPDAIISFHEASVIELKAKSQNLRAMDRAEFQQSKDAVLGVLGELIGVDVTKLLKEAA